MTKTKIIRSDDLTRRRFLGTLGGGCAALTQTSLLATLANLSLIRSSAAAIDTSGYKALVCVFLFGGIDGFNVLMPKTGDDTSGPYGDYRLARGTLALERDDLLGINGETYGLHPLLGDIKGLYDAGNLAFIANVGSLVEPYGSGARLPLGLFSHSDQQRHWQTSTPQSRTQITGWLGRMADILEDSVNNNPAISMNIALENLNILQTGDTVIPYVVDDSNGAEELAGYEFNNPMDLILQGATDNLLGQSYADLLKRTHAGLGRQAIDAAVDYNAATQGITFSPGVTTTLQGTSLGRQLLQVAKAIGARGTLDQTRQVFFVARGGWDNHANLQTAHNALLPELNQALKAFYDATVELNVASDVVTFTASDFARTLNANSNNGSDHAWGGNHLVMGGSVAGGQLYGTYPASLAPGNSLDLGRGRLIPTTSVDEYAAELAMWVGMDNDGALETILPNIRNFYSAGDPNPPLGFVL